MKPWIALGVLAVVGAAAWFVTRDDDASSGEKPPASADAASGAADARVPPPAADTVQGAGDAGGGTSVNAGPAADVATPLTLEQRLEKAFVEIYCAQTRGDVDALLDIYARYGFDEPTEWTTAWREASKNSEWVAKITREAGEKCP